MNEQEKLLTWNKAAFFLHVLSFASALIVTLVFQDQSFQVELTTDFRIYDASAPGPSSAGPFSPSLASLGFYQLIWVDLPFPLITALFHGAIAWIPAVRTFYLKSHIDSGSNSLRWIEYSITASLMVWVISQLAGITNVVVLVAQVLINVAMQLQGYLMEALNSKDLLSRGRRKNYVPLITGWLLFAAQWTLILTYFFSAITSERPPGVEQVPWYVYSIVIGLFLIFSAFGLISTLHYYPLLGSRFRWFLSNYNYEWSYIFMSFSAKLFLTWNLLIGIATNPLN